MLVPHPDVESQLLDTCPECKAVNQPVVLDGQSVSPFVAYRCSCGKRWVTQFEQKFVKKGTSEPKGLINATEPSPPQFNDYTSAGPLCKGCGSPLGQPHASSCPYM